MTKELYRQCKEKKMCVRCTVRPARENKVMCETCAKKVANIQYERKKWLKSIHFCPDCGSNKLMGDEKRCPECLAKAYIANIKTRRKHYGSNHDYYVMDIAKLKENGLCRGCRRKKVAEGHTYCMTCLVKKRERDRQDRLKKTGDGLSRSERYSYGLCYRCGEPLDTDKRLCSTCCEATAKNFRGIRGTNAYWQADNKRVFGGAANG